MKIRFRPYQQRMILAQNQFISDPSRTRATVLAATGSGKTEVFLDLLRSLFAKHTAARVLVVHPRIALSQDQQKRFAQRLRDFEPEFTSFHSGHQKYHTLIDRKNLSTTDVEQLEHIRKLSAGHHITFSSYASLHKVAALDYDVIICDEAHYLTQADLRENLHLLQAKTLFYTATPVEVAAAEESMDNTELFGDIIAEVPPSELIAYGYVVPPRLRTINIKNLTRNDTYDYPRIIARAYQDQRSHAHHRFNHKMLVSMPRTGDFDSIMQELSVMRSESGCEDLDVYYVTADRAVKNGAPLRDRETALEDFGENLRPCVIIHCDTLAEGIDVDGLGGVLVMRGLGMVKAIQTMGRGCRPARADIKKNGEIRKHRIKTECIVTLARVDGEWTSDARIREWAEIFRTAGYGDIWDFYDHTPAQRAGDTELDAADDRVFDIVEDIRISDGADTLWSELFGEAA